MKRISAAIVLVLATSMAIAAQPWAGRGMGNGMANTQAAPQAKSLEGKLLFVDKYPALQTKDATYMLEMPQFFFYAYTDGIKEGATVKVDGYEFPKVPGQDKAYFQVTKAVINGKTYDFTTQGFGRGMMGGMGDGKGSMMGGRGRR